MKQLSDLIVPGDSAPQLVITVDDGPPNGVAYRYEITNFDTNGNPAQLGPDEVSYRDVDIVHQDRLSVIFQHGPVSQGRKPNGVTEAALLAIVADRLASIDDGSSALEHIRYALVALQGVIC